MPAGLQVQRLATPLSLQQMRAVLGLTLAARGEDSPAVLANLLALAALENGRGKSIIQHNWGNIMATPQWRKENQFWERKDPTIEPRFFRAYSSHDEGAKAFVDLLYSSRHKGAIEAAQVDDTAGMGESLFRSSYVVAIPSDKHPRGLSPLEQQAEYSQTLQKLKEEFSVQLPQQPPRQSPQQSKSSALGIALPMLGVAFATMVITGRKK